MAAAAASAHAMNQATKKRHEAARKRQEEEYKIMKLMNKYDKSKDGKLDKKEFGDLLQVPCSPWLQVLTSLRRKSTTGCVRPTRRSRTSTKLPIGRDKGTRMGRWIFKK